MRADWLPGPVYYLLKFATWACLVLLGSVFVSFITTHEGLHAHPNNINCAIQCIKNPLKENIPIILEQKSSCLTEKEQVEETLSKCTMDLKNAQDDYTTQTKELAEIKEAKDSVIKERDRLRNDCKQNYTNATKEKDKALNQTLSCLSEKDHLQGNLTSCKQYSTELKEAKDSVIKERDWLRNDCKQNYTNATKEKDKALNQTLSCLSEKDHLQGNLTSCKQNSTELKVQLDDAANKSERLATYIEHLRLLEVIDNHTRELETCRVWLKEYCALKSKSSSLNEYENYTMDNFADWLGCKDPLPDAGHYDKILPLFIKRVKSILEVREKLEQMLIKGNFKAMKNAQDGVQNLPSEKCQFLCTYSEDDEENEESDDNDPSSSFGVKAIKAGWNIFTRVWW